MGRPLLEVADVMRAHGDELRTRAGSCLTPARRWVLRDLMACRTAALGGHVAECTSCGETRIAYNSCRNRHCPKCQATRAAAWVESREADLLPVEYFHVVFTVPECIGAVALQNKREVYGILFRAAAETLREIASDPKHLGAEIGCLAVLHTWAQNLQHHPHVHCVVPGGGLSLDGQRWVRCRPGFFLPVRVLSRVFRGKFLDFLDRARRQGRLRFQGGSSALCDRKPFAALVKACRKQEWVVYAKPPFAGPSAVLKYLSRYTHRVAISNRRLLSLENGQVRFRCRDVRGGHRLRTMTLSAVEFLRRFLLHVLPRGFVRIRHYGFLSNRARSRKLESCRRALDVPSRPVEVIAPSPGSIPACPRCGAKNWIVTDRVVLRRPRPTHRNGGTSIAAARGPPGSERSHE